MRRRHELEDEMKQAEVSASWRGLERGACDREQTKPGVTELCRVKDGGSGRAVLRGRKEVLGKGWGPGDLVLLSGGAGRRATWSADKC